MQLQNCPKCLLFLHTGFTLQSCLSPWCPQRLDRLSGRGTHFVIAALHSTGASKRLSVVTLRIRRYTSREMMPALRALLPRTKENSLTWASPAATIHLMYWLVFGSRRDKTSAARTNFMMTTDKVRTIRTVSSYTTKVGNT